MQHMIKWQNKIVIFAVVTFIQPYTILFSVLKEENFFRWKHKIITMGIKVEIECSTCVHLTKARFHENIFLFLLLLYTTSNKMIAWKRLFIMVKFLFEQRYTNTPHYNLYVMDTLLMWLKIIVNIYWSLKK